MKRTAISHPTPHLKRNPNVIEIYDKTQLLTCAEIGTRKPNTELISIPQPRKPSDPYFLAITPKGICEERNVSMRT